MKYALLFAAVVNGEVTPINDDDGFKSFPNYRACVMYAIKRAPDIGALLRDFLPGFDGVLLWRCAS